MFSGKTEWLIHRLRREQAAGRRVRAFKHAVDVRYDAEHLITHTDERFPATRAADADALLELAGDAEVVGIDEGQFFGGALVRVVRELAARGVTVLVAGITHDAWGRQFEPIPQLAALADEQFLRQAPCAVCGRASPFTQRMVPVRDGQMVGGPEEYEPRCVEHFEPLPGPPEPR